ncbi:MAG: hypothetical protein BEN18_04005 [Epulopiscium sp. Nuni2H_MBin001]|nr:MAG: hypothetical protein BEN18_04005 [Epulopiscium sp. Nuni2H_MBin001]
MKILYFTATGNSLYVAKSLGGELLSIPQMIKEGRYEFNDDKIGVVFPLYEWSVCSYVAEFLKKATFHTDYLFAIATYGIFAGGVASHVEQLGEEHGYKFSYINKIKMVDNFLPTFSMKKEIENEHKKNIEEQIAAVRKDIENSKEFVITEAAVRRKMTQGMVKREEKQKDKTGDKGIKKVVRIEESCTKCGVCTKVCAVNNINLDKESGEISFENKCFSCYACIQNCPSNAIHIKTERDDSRFRNSHITLAEIIKSNN